MKDPRIGLSNWGFQIRAYCWLESVGFRILSLEFRVEI